MPRREDLDPIRMPRHLLPFLILWDVADIDFHVRLAGTEVCNTAGRELRGLSLSEVQGEDNREVREIFEAVATGTVYSLVEGSMDGSKRDDALYQHLLLPLSMKQGRAAHLVGAFAFPGRLNQFPQTVS